MFCSIFINYKIEIKTKINFFVTNKIENENRIFYNLQKDFMSYQRVLDIFYEKIVVDNNPIMNSMIIKVIDEIRTSEKSKKKMLKLSSKMFNGHHFVKMIDIAYFDEGPGLIEKINFFSKLSCFTDRDDHLSFFIGEIILSKHTIYKLMYKHQLPEKYIIEILTNTKIKLDPKKYFKGDKLTISHYPNVLRCLLKHQKKEFNEYLLSKNKNKIFAESLLRIRHFCWIDIDKIQEFIMILIKNYKDHIRIDRIVNIARFFITDDLQWDLSERFVRFLFNTIKEKKFNVNKICCKKYHNELYYYTFEHDQKINFDYNNGNRNCSFLKSLVSHENFEHLEIFLEIFEDEIDIEK